MKILLVDDDPLVLRALLRHLKDLGVEAATADRVESAFAAVVDDYFELIVSDIDMPDGTGFDLVRKLITKMPMFATERVIFMTGLVTEPKEWEARRLGATIFEKTDLKGLVAEIRRRAGI